MPTLDWNKSTWDGLYDWSQSGDEWSAVWGGPAAQWHFALFPRIQAFLPADTILEIAPGYGRWTRHLQNHCTKLIAVDYAEKCVATCRERFKRSPHIDCHINDGLTLPMVADRSVDFAFSFDSLVHADRSIVTSYIHELGRVLAADGVAVLHHSNLAEVIAKPADKFATEVQWHHRGTDVSHAIIAEVVAEAGLVTIGQELMNWGVTLDLTDCLTVLTRLGSRFARENVVVRNPEFMADAARIRMLAELYAAND